MKFQIKSRWSPRVVFECELDASFETKSEGEKMGEAVRKALANGADMSGANMSGANMSGANMSGANMSNANMSNADMSGANMSNADMSNADMSGANMSGANMSNADMSNADMSGANMSGANMSNANMSGANMSNANMRGANMSNANMSNANMRGAELEGVPFIINIHQAVYHAASVPPEALNMSTWHTCETTHCRAGWAVTLAGEAGKALEWAMGTSSAAAMIYLRSDPHLEKVPNFYATNEEALEDMKLLAEQEKARNEPEGIL